jgi:Rap1a immunity proteins
MRAAAFILAVAGAVLATTVSSAEPAMTAGDLQQLCAGTDHVSVNACRIYILGVTQGITVGMNMAGGKDRAARLCLPSEGLTAEELAQKVKANLDRRLAANPADRDLEAASFIGKVLTDTVRCPKGTR